MHLGRLLGECQHIVCRGMGGTSLAVLNSPADAALLCGSAVLRSGCHGAAEKLGLQAMESEASTSRAARTPAQSR